MTAADFDGLRPVDLEYTHPQQSAYNAALARIAEGDAATLLEAALPRPRRRRNPRRRTMDPAPRSSRRRRNSRRPRPPLLRRRHHHRARPPRTARRLRNRTARTPPDPRRHHTRRSSAAHHTRTNRPHRPSPRRLRHRTTRLPRHARLPYLPPGNSAAAGTGTNHYPRPDHRTVADHPARKDPTRNTATTDRTSARNHARSPHTGSPQAHRPACTQWSQARRRPSPHCRQATSPRTTPHPHRSDPRSSSLPQPHRSGAP